VLVREISVATNEPVSFTRSGMWKRVKDGRKKINAMCAIMIWQVSALCP
jgi:hypothetical protein